MKETGHAPKNELFLGETLLVEGTLYIGVEPGRNDYRSICHTPTIPIGYLGDMVLGEELLNTLRLITEEFL